MSTLDVQRATAIINRAMEHDMFTLGKMPEAESDRIIAAEELIQLAEQVEQVKNAWLAQGGPKAVDDNMGKNWKAAEAVLFEAQVTMGSGESNGHAAGGPQLDVPAANAGWSGAPEPIQQEIEGGDAHTTATGSQGVRLPDATPPQSVDLTGAPEPATTREGPQDGAVWADAQGEEWEVLSYGGGPSAEVMKVSTGEKTLVPAGMLKTKVRDAPVIHEDRVSMIPRSDGSTEFRVPTKTQDAPEQIAIEPTRPMLTEPSIPQPETIGKHIDRSNVPDTSIPEHDDEDDERYQSILAETEERYTPAGWVIPHELQEPPDLMPEMLDQVPDVMAQRYHSQFNAAAARAKYLHDVEDARARGCKLTRKLFLRGAMRKAREQIGGSSTITEREAWAEDFDDDVRVWGERANKHEENARAWKTFFDLYTQNVVVLSRDWTMRDQQEKS